MKKAKLAKEIEDCFIDWHEGFDIDVQEESVHKGWSYFSVFITYKSNMIRYKSHSSFNIYFQFSSRINDEGECEMDYEDQCWKKINKGNMFEFMWFDTIQRIF